MIRVFVSSWVGDITTPIASLKCGRILTPENWRKLRNLKNQSPKKGSQEGNSKRETACVSEPVLDMSKASLGIRWAAGELFTVTKIHLPSRTQVWLELTSSWEPGVPKNGFLCEVLRYWKRLGDFFWEFINVHYIVVFPEIGGLYHCQLSRYLCSDIRNRKGTPPGLFLISLPDWSSSPPKATSFVLFAKNHLYRNLKLSFKNSSS